MFVVHAVVHVLLNHVLTYSLKRKSKVYALQQSYTANYAYNANFCVRGRVTSKRLRGTTLHRQAFVLAHQ